MPARVCIFTQSRKLSWYRKAIMARSPEGGGIRNPVEPGSVLQRLTQKRGESVAAFRERQAEADRQAVAGIPISDTREVVLVPGQEREFGAFPTYLKTIDRDAYFTIRAELIKSPAKAHKAIAHFLHELEHHRYKNPLAGFLSKYIARIFTDQGALTETLNQNQLARLINTYLLLKDRGILVGDTDELDVDALETQLLAFAHMKPYMQGLLALQRQLGAEQRKSKRGTGNPDAISALEAEIENYKRDRGYQEAASGFAPYAEDPKNSTFVEPFSTVFLSAKYLEIPVEEAALRVELKRKNVAMFQVNTEAHKDVEARTPPEEDRVEVVQLSERVREVQRIAKWFDRMFIDIQAILERDPERYGGAYTSLPEFALGEIVEHTPSDVLFSILEEGARATAEFGRIQQRVLHELEPLSRTHNVHVFIKPIVTSLRNQLEELSGRVTTIKDFSKKLETEMRVRRDIVEQYLLYLVDKGIPEAQVEAIYNMYLGYELVAPNIHDAEVKRTSVDAATRTLVETLKTGYAPWVGSVYDALAKQGLVT